MPVLLGGCHLFGGSGDASSVRLIDAVPNAESVRVAVGGKKVFSGCHFGTGTGFEGIAAGRYDIYTAIQQATGGDFHLPMRSVDAQPHHRYTALALGVASGDPAARLAVFDDRVPKDPLPRDQAIVRVASAVPDAGRLDVLVNGIVAFKDLRFGERSDPLPLAALPYEWTIKVAGGYVTPLAGPTTLTLRGGRSYLIVLMGRASDHTIGIQEFQD